MKRAADSELTNTQIYWRRMEEAAQRARQMERIEPVTPHRRSSDYPPPDGDRVQR